MLGGEGQACDEAALDQSQARPLFQITVEGVNGSKQEATDTHVGSDRGAMGQKVWFEDKECQSEKRRGRPEKFLGGFKDKEREEHAQQGRHHARAEEQYICVI